MENEQFKLVVENAVVPGMCTAFSFKQDRVSIGRTQACDVWLLSRARLVSREHAEIRRVNGVFLLVDLGSRNATWLNRERLEAKRPYVIHHGDCFQVGDFQIQFVMFER